MLSHLFETGQIDLRRGSLFDVAPEPMPASLDWERVEGMMLGLAIGDALGATSEGLLPGPRRARYGEIRGYLPHPYADNRPVGLPTDDTQLAFWTLEQMIADRGFDPEQVAARFCSERIYGIGSTVRRFVANFRAGLPWYRCGPKSAGNGALMRIAPMLIPHLASGTPDLWADAALSAMITHNDSASISACLSFVHMLWHLLQIDAPPAAVWWPQAYVEAARELEADETYRPRGGPFAAYQGTLWRFVEAHVPEAFAAGLPTVDACNAWGSGAYLLETVPSVLYILMRHGGDFEEAIVRAVNDTVDNDTVAAIVGAAVGALHGVDAIPERWRSGLLGRTTAVGDDGRASELLAQARALWWRGAQMPVHPEGFRCTQCGACCRAYVQVTEGDLVRWAAQGRRDILRCVSPVEGWIEPVTRGGLPACPFLRQGPRQGTYLCRVYSTRPEACRTFPASRAQAERIGCRGLAGGAEPDDAEPDEAQR
jgi:ADP-ribosyl-[dinitrogen reductase] hydrolase